MKNSFETIGNDDTPSTETAPVANQELQELIARRGTLLNWIEAGAGIAADRVLLDKLDRQIADLENKSQ